MLKSHIMWLTCQISVRHWTAPVMAMKGVGDGVNPNLGWEAVRSRGHPYITAKTDSNKQALTFTSTSVVKFIVSNRPRGLQCPGCLKPLLTCRGHSAWKVVGVEIEKNNFMLSVTNLKSQLWAIKTSYWKRLSCFDDFLQRYHYMASPNKKMFSSRWLVDCDKKELLKAPQCLKGLVQPVWNGSLIVHNKAEAVGERATYGYSKQFIWSFKYAVLW